MLWRATQRGKEHQRETETRCPTWMFKTIWNLHMHASRSGSARNLLCRFFRQTAMAILVPSARQNELIEAHRSSSLRIAFAVALLGVSNEL